VTKIHIKIADRGWILEKCAAELVKIDPRVTYDTEPRADADLQYYVNYSSYRGRTSPIEVGFFTHVEEQPEARQRFFDVASKMDHCVCMAERYAEELRLNGVQNVTIIRPGVDLEGFKPRLRIGVVGRTYHTGRKGEALIEQVMDVDGIDWFFTGSGWPGRALNIPSDEMSTFYNSLDYVLVPANREGGPMCVLEGLACGKEIISSDVGWVPNFPHISFENGNADSLRAVLRSLLAKRYQLRASVESCTWDAWAKSHIELFEQLLRDRRPELGLRATATTKTASSGVDGVVVLATHGNEKGSRGGPSIRVPRTVRALQEVGVNAVEYGVKLVRPDLVHLFNIWPAASSSRFLEETKRAAVPLVFSPIFLNLTTHQLYSATIPEIYQNFQGAALDHSLAEIRRELESQPNLPLQEPYADYHDQVCQIVGQADHVIVLSEFERRCLDFLGAIDTRKTTIVHNPVNADLFDGVDRDLFRKRYGLKDYVLQVGRIEARKNQLMVAEACRRLDVPAVFIGHDGDPTYASLLRQIAGPKAIFVQRLAQTDPMFASAIAGASAFCLPSWAEGAPLAALEAGAAGVPLVLSDRSGEREYFGDHALYVNPADLPGLMQAIETARAQGENGGTRQARSSHVRERFDWTRHARETAAVYERVLAQQPPVRDKRQIVPDGRIFFDVTDWVHAGERLTGTARVQYSQFHSLPPELAKRVVPVSWIGGTNSLFVLTPEEIRAGNIADRIGKRQDDHPSALRGDAIRPGDRLYSSSGAWIGNFGHFEALLRLKRIYGLPIGCVIHDLVRVDLAHLYDEKRARAFSDRLTELAKTVDCFLTYSNATEQSLADFLRQKMQLTLSGASFPLGEGSALDGSADSTVPAEMRSVSGPFMVVVGSVEPRKNHIVLLQALKRLKAEFGVDAPMLVIAGADHLGSPALDHWLAANPDVADLVIRIRNASDPEIAWLYENALLSLYPSIGEGWGLPVAESCQHGLVCLASDVSSIPEAARGFAVLLDPYDPVAWCDAIAERIREPEILARERRRIVAEWQPRSWQESVSRVLDAVQSFPVRTPKNIDIPINQLLDLSDRESLGILRDYFAEGFHEFEKAGIWQGRVEATLILPPLPAGSVNRISMRLHAFLVPNEKARTVTLRLNGVPIGTHHVGAKPELYEFSVPDSVDLQRWSTLSIVVNRLTSPRAQGASSDARELGVFVCALGFFSGAPSRRHFSLLKLRA
jgi:glycosyltransferase involved in cell wall biosynthesis